MSKTPTYRSWTKMKERCSNYKRKYAHRYVGRGIKVCKRWMNSFSNFLKDMGEKPTPKHTLERVNNEDGYKPSNCIWATQKEQTNNTCRSRKLTVNGKTKSISEWSKETGLKYWTILHRIKRGSKNVLRPVLKG